MKSTLSRLILVASIFNLKCMGQTSYGPPSYKPSYKPYKPGFSDILYGVGKKVRQVKGGILRGGGHVLRFKGDTFYAGANTLDGVANRIDPRAPRTPRPAPTANPQPPVPPPQLQPVAPLPAIPNVQGQPPETEFIGPLITNGNSQRLQVPFKNGRAPAAFNRLQQSFQKQRLVQLQQQQAHLQQLLQRQHQQRIGPTAAAAGGGVGLPPLPELQILQTNGGTCDDRLGQLLGDIFIGHEMIPQVLETPPIYPLELTYRTIRTYPGMRLTTDATRFNPMMHWPAEPGAYYTIIISNLDINSRRNRSLAEFWHWFVANVPGNSVGEGEEIFQLLHPLVLPEGNGGHRYGYFVMKQPGLMDYSDEGGPSDNCSPTMSVGRGPYRSTKDFMKKYGLKLTAATFLIVDTSPASIEIACEWQACMGGQVFLRDLTCSNAAAAAAAAASSAGGTGPPKR